MRITIFFYSRVPDHRSTLARRPKPSTGKRLPTEAEWSVLPENLAGEILSTERLRPLTIWPGTSGNGAAIGIGSTPLPRSQQNREQESLSPYWIRDSACSEQLFK